MVHRAEPVGLLEREALVIRDRYKWSIRILADKIRQTWQVQTSMRRRDERNAKSAEQRQVKPIDVDVDHVEGCGALSDCLQQTGLRSNGIQAGTTKPKGTLADRNKFRASVGIAACEKGDVVPEFHQLVG
jgi:hypothetical protein